MKTYSIFSISIVLVIIFSSTVLAERLSIAPSIANIRSGPGTGYDVLWQVAKYHPILVLKKTGAWYHFRDFEDDTGTKFKILFTTEKGVPFKILKRKGNWIHVQHADGDKGWIHKSLVW
ncbi:MAG: SH3 domain-containing protein [Deltaproteobacteria bacterium]|nr:SH3 domain-containing protein [Deltaproteobacteria bacterium]